MPKRQAEEDDDDARGSAAPAMPHRKTAAPNDITEASMDSFGSAEYNRKIIDKRPRGKRHGKGVAQVPVGPSRPGAVCVAPTGGRISHEEVHDLEVGASNYIQEQGTEQVMEGESNLRQQNDNNNGTAEIIHTQGGLVQDGAAIQAELAPDPRDQRENTIQRVYHQFLGQAVVANVITDPEQIEQAPSNKNRRKRQICLGIVAVLLVIAAVAIPLGVVLTGRQGKSPVPPPSRFEIMSQRLVEVFGNSLLVNSSVPFDALQWLVYNDTAMLHESDTPLDVLADRYVAVLLYFAMGGSNWTEHLQFLSNTSICEWNTNNSTNSSNLTIGTNDDNVDKGIFCNEDGQMTAISLPRNNINGSIPLELSKLKHLTHLDFDENSVVGRIPEEIGNLSSLEFLDFGSNGLTGSIPESVYALTAIKTLYLNYNTELQGTISKKIGQLGQLNSLSFHKCRLVGPIPDTIGNLSSLKNLNAAHSELNGTIPASLHRLPNLTKLSLWDAFLSGTIPPFDGANKLEIIYYDQNALVGTIPPSMGMLPLLEEASFSENAITGTIPSFAGSNGVLRMFFVHGNQLTGGLDTFVASILNSPLEVFAVYDNQLTGTIPTEVGALASLLEVGFNKNNINGTIPTEMGNLTNLEFYLDLGNSMLSGTLPTELGKLTALTWFVVWGNQLSGTIPTEFGQMTELRQLDFGLNMLTGTLPTEFGQLTNLMVWGFAGNKIQGTFPIEFKSLLPTLREYDREYSSRTMALVSSHLIFLCNTLREKRFCLPT